MVVHTAAAAAMLERLNGCSGSTMAMMLVLLPATRSRRKGRDGLWILCCWPSWGLQDSWALAC
jgi:hypothetical protein